MISTAMPVLRRGCIPAVFLLLASITYAQVPVSAGYKIGPRDIIRLTIVAGGAEQSKVDLVVSGQGEIAVPFLGNVAAAGFTLKELEKNLYIPLEKDYFVSPQVNIQIKEYHSLSFTISGAVRNPGKFELDFNPTLLDLIAGAGGVEKDRGNVAYILRDGRQGAEDSTNINLTKLLDEGDLTQNVRLQTGDKVYIPRESRLNQADTKIYLEGELKRPGMVDFQPGLTALSACIMSGGFGKYAAPARARIIRMKDGKPTIIKVDLEKINDGQIPDVKLQPGDRIHVPESWL